MRNGEGVHHVMRVQVTGAPDPALARSLGKAIVNAPLFKCAVAGNDPNVGRLVQAIGRHVGAHAPGLGPVRTRACDWAASRFFPAAPSSSIPAKEAALVAHLRQAELYASAPPKNGVFTPPVDFPAHERCVEIEVDLGLGRAGATVLGADLTHEYISENADYRSLNGRARSTVWGAAAFASRQGRRRAYWFTCTTFAGGKPLKYVEEAWL